MKRLIYVFLISSASVFGQTQTSKEFTFNEFLGYVKKFHPLVKTANLKINSAQANLMTARGAFDPKIEVDFEQKKFKEKEYYSLLNSSFKIPTWYGIELKGGFDNNDGTYLNPENTVPNKGLASVGISVPLGQGLFINQRMADLRKAKLQLNLSKAERDLEAVAVLYDASIAFFNWKKAHNEFELYQQYLSNAETRYIDITKLIAAGDKPAIDSVEAGITVKNRKLSFEDAKLKLLKAKLELSNFIWLENNIPMELQDDMFPEINLYQTVEETLGTNDFNLSGFSMDNHPKITALNSKLGMLDVERKFKANMLLPKINLGYSYLSEPSYFNNYNFQDYKVSLNFAFPLFLRKERGSLQLTKYKIQELKFELNLQRLQLQNKVTAQQNELASLKKQIKIIDGIVNDNQIMADSEQKLFRFGESSLFLINTRENNLVSAKLSKIAIENRYLESNAMFFKIISNFN